MVCEGVCVCVSVMILNKHVCVCVCVCGRWFIMLLAMSSDLL